ncbi:hypothetical protein DFJ73DRAFT_769659 [Zopfochytrium polystomum]|nr:hypothetical protein DFJ73DRAFT_769659 [Zopfochytrium polystomum]
MYEYQVNSGLSKNKLVMKCYASGKPSYVSSVSNSTVEVGIYLDPLVTITKSGDLALLVAFRGSGGIYSGKDRFTGILSYFSDADLKSWYKAYPDVQCSVLSLKPGCNVTQTTVTSTKSAALLWTFLILCFTLANKTQATCKVGICPHRSPSGACQDPLDTTECNTCVTNPKNPECTEKDGKDVNASVWDLIQDCVNYLNDALSKMVKDPVSTPDRPNAASDKVRRDVGMGDGTCQPLVSSHPSGNPYHELLTGLDPNVVLTRRGFGNGYDLSSEVGVNCSKNDLSRPCEITVAKTTTTTITTSLSLSSGKDESYSVSNSSSWGIQHSNTDVSSITSGLESNVQHTNSTENPQWLRIYKVTNTTTWNTQHTDMYSSEETTGSNVDSGQDKTTMRDNTVNGNNMAGADIATSLTCTLSREVTDSESDSIGVTAQGQVGKGPVSFGGIAVTYNHEHTHSVSNGRITQVMFSITTIKSDTNGHNWGTVDDQGGSNSVTTGHISSDSKETRHGDSISWSLMGGLSNTTGLSKGVTDMYGTAITSSVGTSTERGLVDNRGTDLTQTSQITSTEQRTQETSKSVSISIETSSSLIVSPGSCVIPICRPMSYSTLVPYVCSTSDSKKVKYYAAEVQRIDTRQGVPKCILDTLVCSKDQTPTFEAFSQYNDKHLLRYGTTYTSPVKGGSKDTSVEIVNNQEAGIMWTLRFMRDTNQVGLFQGNSADPVWRTGSVKLLEATFNITSLGQIELWGRGLFADETVWSLVWSTQSVNLRAYQVGLPMDTGYKLYLSELGDLQLFDGNDIMVWSRLRSSNGLGFKYPFWNENPTSVLTEPNYQGQDDPHNSLPADAKWWDTDTFQAGYQFPGVDYGDDPDCSYMPDGTGLISRAYSDPNFPKYKRETGRLRLYLAKTGNLVIYDGSRVSWESKTADLPYAIPPYRATFDSLGKFVVKDSHNSLIWTTATSGLTSVSIDPFFSLCATNTTNSDCTSWGLTMENNSWNVYTRAVQSCDTCTVCHVLDPPGPLIHLATNTMSSSYFAYNRALSIYMNVNITVPLISKDAQWRHYSDGFLTSVNSQDTCLGFNGVNRLGTLSMSNFTLIRCTAGNIRLDKLWSVGRQYLKALTTEAGGIHHLLPGHILGNDTLPFTITNNGSLVYAGKYAYVMKKKLNFGSPTLALRKDGSLSITNLAGNLRDCRYVLLSSAHKWAQSTDGNAVHCYEQYTGKLSLDYLTVNGPVNIGSVQMVDLSSIDSALTYQLSLYTDGTLVCTDSELTTYKMLSGGLRLRDSLSKEIYSFPDARPDVQVLDSNFNSYLLPNEKLILSNTGYYFNAKPTVKMNGILRLTNRGTVELRDHLGAIRKLQDFPPPQDSPANGYTMTISDAGVLTITDDAGEVVWIQDITATSSSISANVISMYNGLCLDSETVNGKPQVVMKTCTSSHNPGWYFGTDAMTFQTCGTTQWFYDSGTFSVDGNCMTLNETSAGISKPLYMSPCDQQNKDLRQQWNIGSSLPAYVNLRTLYMVNNPGNCLYSCSSKFDVTHQKFYSDLGTCADGNLNFGSFCFMTPTDWSFNGYWVMSGGKCLDYNNATVPCLLENPRIMWSFDIADVTQATYKMEVVNQVHVNQCASYGDGLYVNTVYISPLRCQIDASGVKTCAVGAVIIPPSGSNSTRTYVTESTFEAACDRDSAWIFESTGRLRMGKNPGQMGELTIQGRNSASKRPMSHLSSKTNWTNLVDTGDVVSIMFNTIVGLESVIKKGVAINRSTGRILLNDGGRYWTGPAKLPVLTLAVTATPVTIFEPMMFSGAYIDDRSCLTPNFESVRCDSPSAGRWTFNGYKIMLNSNCLNSATMKYETCDMTVKTQDYQPTGTEATDVTSKAVILKNDAGLCTCGVEAPYNCECSSAKVQKWIWQPPKLMLASNPRYCIDVTATPGSVTNLVGCIWSENWTYTSKKGLISSKGNLCLDSNVAGSNYRLYGYDCKGYEYLDGIVTSVQTFASYFPALDTVTLREGRYPIPQFNETDESFGNTVDLSTLIKCDDNLVSFYDNYANMLYGAIDSPESDVLSQIMQPLKTVMPLVNYSNWYNPLCNFMNGLYSDMYGYTGYTQCQTMKVDPRVQPDLVLNYTSAYWGGNHSAEIDSLVATVLDLMDRGLINMTEITSPLGNQTQVQSTMTAQTESSPPRITRSLSLPTTKSVSKSQTQSSTSTTLPTYTSTDDWDIFRRSPSTRYYQDETSGADEEESGAQSDIRSLAIVLLRRVDTPGVSAATASASGLFGLVEKFKDKLVESFNWLSLKGLEAKMNDPRAPEHVRNILNSEAISRGTSLPVARFEAIRELLELADGITQSTSQTSEMVTTILANLDKVTSGVTEVQAGSPAVSLLKDKVMAKSVVGDIVKQYNREIVRMSPIPLTLPKELDLKLVLESLEREMFQAGSSQVQAEIDLRAVLKGVRSMGTPSDPDRPTLEIVSSVLLAALVRDVTAGQTNSNIVDMLRRVYELNKNGKIRGDILGAFEPRGGIDADSITGLSAALKAVRDGDMTTTVANVHAIAKLIPHYKMVYTLSELADRYWKPEMDQWREKGGNSLELVNMITDKLSKEKVGDAQASELTKDELSEFYAAIDTSVTEIGEYYGLNTNEVSDTIRNTVTDGVPSDTLEALAKFETLLDGVGTEADKVNDGGYFTEGEGSKRLTRAKGRFTKLKVAKSVKVAISVVTGRFKSANK